MISSLYQYDWHPGIPQFGLATTVPPTEEPVTVAELEYQLRVSLPASDPGRSGWVAMLTGAIKAARETIEEATCRRALTQTVVMTLEKFPPTCPIELPVSPVQGVTSVSYLDSNNVATPLTTYTSNLNTTRPLIFAPPDLGWPPTRWSRPDVVTITFVAGWASVALVPERFKQAIKLLAVNRIENPGDSMKDGPELPPSVCSAIQSLSARPYI